MANSNQLQQQTPSQQQQQQQQQQQAASAAVIQANVSTALASLLPQSTNLHHLTAALAQNSNNIKMEYNNIKMEYSNNNKNDNEDLPTDLSTASSTERKYIKNEFNGRESSNSECYP